MKVHEAVLRMQVRESNAIEGISARPGNPLYDGHILAARIAAEGRVVHPNVLHKTLTRRIVPNLWLWGGVYRTGGTMMVGEKVMPHWSEVPRLMEHWWGMVESLPNMPYTDRAEAAILLHTWLLCIHPYVDGNGRTARLVWNMLRVSCGLPWHIELARCKHRYYAEISAVEEQVFKKEYPDVY